METYTECSGISLVIQNSETGNFNGKQFLVDYRRNEIVINGQISDNTLYAHIPLYYYKEMIVAEPYLEVRQHSKGHGQILLTVIINSLQRLAINQHQPIRIELEPTTYSGIRFLKKMFKDISTRSQSLIYNGKMVYSLYIEADGEIKFSSPES